MDKLIPNLVYDRGTMQVAHMVHAVSTVLMMCMFALHIYLGTIGMRGAYTAMRTGYVDEALGPRAPRVLVRGHRSRQDPGAAQPAAGDRRRRRNRAPGLKAGDNR